ncbi:MAG: PrsW family intramembrane metalloprotease [Candidatus Methylumidiphilus sp.]
MPSLSDQNKRLIVGSPLRHRNIALALSAGLLALLGFAVVMLSALLSGMRPDAAKVFLFSLAAASVCSVVPLLILWWLDRRERESPWLFLFAFLWGGLIATSLALPINHAILADVGQWVAKNPWIRAQLGQNAAHLLGAPIAGPLVEEITKGIGVLLLFFLLRAEFDNMRDGFIYGAVVGIGFNWMETPLYVAQAYAQFGDAPWELQLGARFALFGLAGHAMFSGLFGAFVGLARQTRHWVVRLGAPVLGLLLAMLAHAIGNLLPLIVTLIEASTGKPQPTSPEPPQEYGLLEAWASASLLDLVVFLPFVALMLFLLWRSGLWESEVIRDELAGEIPDWVTPEEYDAILCQGVFQTRRVHRADQLDQLWSDKLVNAQHELAFRKRRVRDDAGDPESDQLILIWRDEIRRLRTQRDWARTPSAMS